MSARVRPMLDFTCRYCSVSFQSKDTRRVYCGSECAKNRVRLRDRFVWISRDELGDLYWAVARMSLLLDMTREGVSISDLVAA